MSAFSCKRSIVKNKDQICLLNTGGTLGYQESGYVPVKSVERFAKCRISGEVKSTCAVIQNQNLWFLYQGAGNSKSLFLSAGKVFTVLFQLEIKLSRFSFYNFFSLCSGKCLP